MRMHPHQTLALLLTLFVSYAQAVERRCIVPHIEAMLGGKGGTGTVDTAAYAEPQTLLFLSDSAETTAGGLSLGALIADSYPEKVIVRSDFTFSGHEVKGNLSTMFMDNTKRFPFPNNTFDTIVMRRGLCICGESGHVCGGFMPISNECRQFFEEVTRVLNKTNPKAKAVLHGTYGVFPEVEAEWFAISEKLEEVHGVAVEIMTTPWGGFNSVVISPKKP